MPYIRTLTENDWNEFNILEIDAFPNDPNEKDVFVQWITRDGFFGLFNDQNILVGYLYCAIYSEYAHLHRIGVLSTERGKGYGSMLFEKAISYFEEHQHPKFNLFVESHNSVAISLYKKYGLEIIFEAWHFIINLDMHKSVAGPLLTDISSREITIDDFNKIKNAFPKADLTELQGMLEEANSKGSTNKYLGMFYKSNLSAIARFNKKFSGCRPFFISDISFFDSFLDQLLKMRDPDKEYIRITFDDNDKLAELCKKRNYSVHHHLFKMARKI